MDCRDVKIVLDLDPSDNDDDHEDDDDDGDSARANLSENARPCHTYSPAYVHELVISVILLTTLVRAVSSSFPLSPLCSHARDLLRVVVYTIILRSHVFSLRRHE